LPSFESQNSLSQDRTDLAYDRTRLAHERTLMAWARTSATLISLGFVIYKFSDGYRPGQGNGSQIFAFLMICIGLISLLLACFQHLFSLEELDEQRTPRPQQSLALAIAFLVCGLGVFGLVVVAFRL
jgi:uncharacterized membrane protein YidH (DUF202 family)